MVFYLINISKFYVMSLMGASLRSFTHPTNMTIDLRRMGEGAQRRTHQIPVMDKHHQLIFPSVRR